MGFNLTPRAMEALARNFREASNESSSNGRQPSTPPAPLLRGEVSSGNSSNQRQSSSSAVPLIGGLNLLTVETGTDLPEKTQIEKLLELPATVSKYVDEKKHEEAHGLVKKLYKLGPAVNFISVLVNFYVSLMKTDRPEKASKVKNEILTILRDNLESDPVDIKNYGIRLQRKKRNFEAILFFQLAGSLHLTELDIGENAVSGLSCCISSLKLATMELLQTKGASKSLIKKHVIPEMRKLKNKIGEFHSIPKRLSCIIEALCLHHIESCEGMVGDTEARQATATEAIQKMRQVFGNEAEKFSLFGTHLHNLGTSFLRSNRLVEAKETFTQAVSAIRNAEDYATQSERRRDLLKAEACLQIVCDQLK